MKASFDQIVDQLIAIIGLDDIYKDEQGGLSLIANEKLIVNLRFEEETNAAVIFTHVGEINTETESKLLKQLLEANLFWVATAGATLSLLPNTGIVVIAQRFALPQVASTEFTASLGAFMDTAFLWLETIEKYNSEGPE